MEQAYYEEWANDELERNAARKADEENRREGYHPANDELVALPTITSMNHDELSAITMWNQHIARSRSTTN